MYDVLIAGGGPAGLTAALYARRAGKSVLVLEGNGFGGQITSSPMVENYPGVASMSGAAFADALMAQVLDLGADAELEKVTGAKQDGDRFVLTAGGAQYEGKSLIIATGARHRPLGVEGERRLGGNGVSYCAVCDGAFFAGEDVAVAGGGDSALQAALFLSGLCKTVYLIHRRDEFRGEPYNVKAVLARENIRPLYNAKITALHGEDALEAIDLYHTDAESTQRLEVAGLFVSIGQQPDNGAFAELVKLDGTGYVAAGEDCAASCPGVFTAGDCRTKGLRQLTTAAGDGSVAAVAACAWADRIG